MDRRVGGLTVAVLLALCSACSPDDEPAPPKVDDPKSITVTSVFGEGDPVQEIYTCDGDGVSPPLSWVDVPDDAAALALVVDDPDAPDGTFTHWVVVDIAPDAGGVTEGGIPRGGVQVENSAGKTSYDGPCPPSGTHHYRFTVYALSEPTGLDDSASLDDALRAIEDTEIAWGRLTGVYARQ